MVSNLHAGREFYLDSLKNNYQLTFSEDFASVMDQIEREYKEKNGLTDASDTRENGQTASSDSLLVRNWQDILAVYVYEESQSGVKEFQMDSSSKNKLAEIFAEMNPIVRDEENPSRVGTGIFWCVLGVVLAFGRWIPAVVDGILILIMCVPAILGKVKIGNNVYFARNCTVFKGVTIGDNCIIGFGSVVTHDIPANSVAVGVPARVVGTVEDYYKKRSTKCISEALAYAKSIEERFHRKPRLDEFWEEFPLFVDKENMHLYPHLPYKRQLRDSFDYWVEHHKRIYDGFEEFLKAAGIE